MNDDVPRTGHPVVDAHVAELFRRARQRAQATGRPYRPRPRRRP